MRYKLFFLFIFFSFFGQYIFAQEVTVLNRTDQQPIFNVFIYNDEHSTITNELGKADLSEFNDDSPIVFQHASFKRYQTSLKEIASRKNIIKLEESVLNIDEIVISASQWEQKKSEVPNRIVTITSRDIHFSNPQSSADLLGISDKVFIQKSQLGGGSPMIRGFSANRLLLVVDGVRMNNAIYRSGNLQNVISLDANTIENSEVILGPGSVIYGSDAIGGVIDFHTRKPRLSTGEKPFIKSNSLLRYSSANKEKTAHLDINVGFRRFAFYSSITRSFYDDLKMGTKNHPDYTRPEYVERINGVDTILSNNNRNIQKFTGYDQINLLEKIRFMPNENLDIEYALHYSKTSDVPRYDRLIEYSGADLKYSEWYYGPQVWMMNALKITESSQNIFYDNSKLTLALQNYEESRHNRKFQASSVNHRTENVKLFTVNLDFDKYLKEKTNLYYGFEITDNLVNSDGFSENIISGKKLVISSRYPNNSKFSSLAIYLNSKHKIREKTSLIFGLRYNQIRVYAPFDTTFFPFPFSEITLNHGALNGSLGAVFQPQKNTQLRVNLSSGFRAPNIDDVGKVFDSEPGNVVVPNENLKPEYIYNLDVGITESFFDRIQFEGSIFASYINNVMVRSDFLFNGKDSIFYDGLNSKVEAVINADYGIVYGISGSVYADIISGISLKSDLNYTRGRDQDNNPLRHVAPTFGGTHLIFLSENFKADFYALYNGQIKNEDLASSESSKPHLYASDDNGNPYAPLWYTVNIKTSYQLLRNLQLNAGIENILDVRYRPYSSGIVAPGRNFIIGIRGIL